MKKTVLVLSTVFASFATMAQTQKGAIVIGGGLGLNTNSSTNNSINSTTSPNTGFFTPQQPETKNSDLGFNFSPTIGYFISDKFALGIYGSYGSRNSKSQTNYMQYSNGVPSSNINYSTADLKNTNSNLGIGIFGDYYISLGEKASFVLGGNLGYFSQKITNQSLGSRPNDKSLQSYYLVYQVYESFISKYAGISANISPAFMFFPSEKWGIKFSLGSFLGVTTGKTTRNYKSLSGSEIVPYEDNNETKSTNTSLSFVSLNTIQPTIGLYYFIK
jgi:hypothetical protein